MTRRFWVSLSAEEAATSKLASTREAVTFACWPPGPEERLVRKATSEAGIGTPRAIRIGSAMLERQKRKVLAAVAPSLEEGEEVRAAFIGQTPIPPITYLLIGPLFFLFLLKFRTIIATDRNLYVFPNKWMRTYAYSGPPYKKPIGEANYESGSMYARVDGGPKLWVMPFGPVKKSLDELTAAVQQAQGAPAA